MAEGSTIIVVSGPSPAVTAALRKHSMTIFGVQFADEAGKPLGSPANVRVRIISVLGPKHEGAPYVLVCGVGPMQEPHVIRYYPVRRCGIVK